MPSAESSPEEAAVRHNLHHGAEKPRDKWPLKGLCLHAHKARQRIRQARLLEILKAVRKRPSSTRHCLWVQQSTAARAAPSAPIFPRRASSCQAQRRDAMHATRRQFRGGRAVAFSGLASADSLRGPRTSTISAPYDNLRLLGFGRTGRYIDCCFQPRVVLHSRQGWPRHCRWNDIHNHFRPPSPASLP